jgi:hypothetical protein
MSRRAGFVFLSVLPFLCVAVVGPRPLRTTPAHQTIGIVLFLAVMASAWALGGRGLCREDARLRKLALAGFLFIVPWAIIALLWVGLGAPFEATLPENYMRFLVLVSDSILITSAFVVLKAALSDAGETFYSAIGFAACMSAGAAYFVCLNISLAQVSMAFRGERTPAMWSDFYSALEFFAVVMTYVTTAAFATALGKARLLGRVATLAYVVASAILVSLMVIRGVEYPEISAATAPWYTRPGVIAGIPAVPWFMPGLLGAVLLRRSGGAQP